MGCIDSKEVAGPKVTLTPIAKGVSEQHIDLHLTNKRVRGNVFTAGGDVDMATFKPKNIPKTREQEKAMRKFGFFAHD